MGRSGRALRQQSACGSSAPARRSASMRPLHRPRRDARGHAARHADRRDARRHPCRHHRARRWRPASTCHRKADGDDGGDVPPHPRGRARAPAGASTSPSTTASRRPPGGSRSCSSPARSATSPRSISTGISTRSTAPTISAAGTRILAHSGSLFVHKATHHFDLLNWYLGSDPRSLRARRAPPLRPRGPFPRRALQDLSAMPSLPALFRHRRRPLARLALRGAVGRRRLLPRRLRLPTGRSARASLKGSLEQPRIREPGNVRRKGLTRPEPAQFLHVVEKLRVAPKGR